MTPSYLLGLFFILIVSLLWTLASVVVQHLYNDLDFDSPFVLVYIGTSLFSIFLPTRLLWERRRRLLFLCKNNVWRRVVIGRRLNDDDDAGWRKLGEVNFENDDDDHHHQLDDDIHKENEDDEEEEEEVIIPWSRSKNQQDNNNNDNNDDDDDDDNNDYMYDADHEAGRRNQSITSTNEENQSILEMKEKKQSSSQQVLTQQQHSETSNNDDCNVATITADANNHNTRHRRRRNNNNNNNNKSSQILTHIDHIKMASIIAPLWFTSNYFYGLSLQYTSITSSTVLASTGSLFTFLFATVCGDEQFTGLKAGGVVSTFVGSVMTGWNDAKTAMEQEKEEEEKMNKANGFEDEDFGNGRTLTMFLDQDHHRRHQDVKEVQTNVDTVTSSFWKWMDQTENDNESIHSITTTTTTTSVYNNNDDDNNNNVYNSKDYKKEKLHHNILHHDVTQDKSPRPSSTISSFSVKSSSSSSSALFDSAEMDANGKTIFTIIPPQAPQDLNDIKSLSSLSSSSSPLSLDIGEEEQEYQEEEEEASDNVVARGTSRRSNIDVEETPTGATSEFHQQQQQQQHYKHDEKKDSIKFQQEQEEQERRRHLQKQQKHQKNKTEQPHQIWGDLAGLLSAMGYGTYTVLLRALCPQDESLMSMSLLFGYVGVLNMVLLMPVFLSLVDFGGYGGGYGGGESQGGSGDDDFSSAAAASVGVHLTTTSLLYVIGKGLLDNVLSDYLWARAVVLTSATVATVGLGLTIPLAFFCDFILGHGKDVIKAESVMGALCVLVGFVFVNMGDGCGSSKKSEEEVENEEEEEEEEVVLEGAMVHDERIMCSSALLKNEQDKEGEAHRML